MSQATRTKVVWAAWMGGGGLVATYVVYALTGSLGWALIALLAAGPILNLLAQMVIQPAKAVRRSRPPHSKPP